MRKIRDKFQSKLTLLSSINTLCSMLIPSSHRSIPSLQNHLFSIAISFSPLNLDMGVHTYTAEFESPVAPARFFKASILHLHEIACKIMPHLIKHCHVEGDGGVGTVKEYHFTEVLPFKHVKERVDELDKEKFVCKYSTVEGGTLGTRYKAGSHKVSFEPAANGGSVCKVVGEIHELDGVEFTEEEKTKTKEGTLATYKTVETYLQANPDAYA